jgi:hypothetical protein
VASGVRNKTKTLHIRRFLHYRNPPSAANCPLFPARLTDRCLIPGRDVTSLGTDYQDCDIARLKTNTKSLGIPTLAHYRISIAHFGGRVGDEQREFQPHYNFDLPANLYSLSTSCISRMSNLPKRVIRVAGRPLASATMCHDRHDYLFRCIYQREGAPPFSMWM